MVALLLDGCQTSEEAVEPDLGTTHYTLRLGKEVDHGTPFGAGTDILVDYYKNNGVRQTVTGFRAWDYDGDGLFEMVEVLNEDGGVQARVFDFNRDGLVDMTK